MPLQGVGLGFRRPWFRDLCASDLDVLDFLEVAPENWINVGGRRRKELQAMLARYPVVCHGLSLSLGGFTPLDPTFIQSLKSFINQNSIVGYTEHLSYCGDEGSLYNLLPIPFTEEAVHHVSARIQQVQNELGRRIAVENISYYAAPGQALTELNFINAILEEADCDLLLDVNNVYVNSVNHNSDPVQFINGLAIESDRMPYLHLAGHWPGKECLIDTHGSAVSAPVWALLKTVYQRFGVRPTLLERDNDLPDFKAILNELNHIRAIQHAQKTSNQITPSTVRVS